MFWKMLGVGVFSFLSILFAWASGLGTVSAVESSESAEHEKKRIQEFIGSHEQLESYRSGFRSHVKGIVILLILSIACIVAVIVLSAVYLH